MTRPERIERALREVVEFIRAHKLEQEPGLDYRARVVKVGEARLENWEGALAPADHCRNCNGSGIKRVPYLHTCRLCCGTGEDRRGGKIPCISDGTVYRVDQRAVESLCSEAVDRLFAQCAPIPSGPITQCPACLGSRVVPYDGDRGRNVMGVCMKCGGAGYVPFVDEEKKAPEPKHEAKFGIATESRCGTTAMPMFETVSTIHADNGLVIFACADDCAKYISRCFAIRCPDCMSGRMCCGVRCSKCNGAGLLVPNVTIERNQ